VRTLHVASANSTRYVLITGRGVGALLQDWYIPARRSPTHAGYHVRTGHLPELRALCDLHGVRLVDEREVIWT
jgi:hypothetical protein